MLDVQWDSFSEQKHNAVWWLVSLNISQCAPLPEVFWKFCSELTNLSPSFAQECEENVVTMLGCFIPCGELWYSDWLKWWVIGSPERSVGIWRCGRASATVHTHTLETLSAAAATRKAYKAEESVEEEDESEEEDSDEESAHEHVPKTSSSRLLSSRSSSNRRSGKSSGGSSWSNNKSASRSTRYSSDYYEEAPIQRSRRPPSDLSVSGKDDALLQVTLL